MHVAWRHMTLCDSLISCTIALLLDLCLGDPRGFPHPVRGIGWLIATLERLLYRLQWRRFSGSVLLISTVCATCLFAFLLLWTSGAIGRYAQIAVSALLIWTTIAVRDLFDHAEQVRIALKSGDLAEARAKLSFLVSRDTANLGETEIARGCVESVAENLVDGTISPLFFALLGGPVLAFAFKAVSTLDSMVGYRNQRYLEFGWASARADDVLNYVPARALFATLPVAALLSGRHALKCLKIMFRDGDKNPSPNSGIPEAAFAGALGIQLGGPNIYEGVVIVKPVLNEEGRPATMQDIRRAQVLLFSATIVTFCFLLALRLFLSALGLF